VGLRRVDVGHAEVDSVVGGGLLLRLLAVVVGVGGEDGLVGWAEQGLAAGLADEGGVRVELALGHGELVLVGLVDRRAS